MSERVADTTASPACETCGMCASSAEQPNGLLRCEARAFYVLAITPACDRYVAHAPRPHP